eukprot:2796087-Pyramimonas_sp.AAC.1
MVVTIGHDDVALPVHGHSPGAVEVRNSALSVLMACLAGARQCGHQALRRYFADAVVPHIGHVGVAVAVHCNSYGAAELSHRPFSVSMACLASARQCGHHALRRDLADAMVAHVGHDDVALHVHRHSAGVAEPSGGALSVFIASQAAARQRGDHALRRDLADAITACVAHNDVALPVHCHSKGPGEMSSGALSVFMAPLASAR